MVSASYQLRSLKPFDAPKWWNAAQLAAHFAGQPTAVLIARLIDLYSQQPADTGAPVGVPRYWHCSTMTASCPLCAAWIDWLDETTALARELSRRIACGEGV